MHLPLDWFGGAGRHTFLVLPGLPQPPTDLHSFCGKLAEVGPVALVHLPGYGRAVSTLRDVGFGAAHEAIVHTVATLDGPVIPLGFSAGSYRAFLLALDRRVPRFSTVLSVGAVAGVSDPDALCGFAEMFDDESDGLTEILLARMLSPRSWTPTPPSRT